MTTVTVTKRGNVRVNGEKFYAVPDPAVAQCGAPCPGRTSAICNVLPCTASERNVDGYRLRGTPVTFVTREEFLTHKENSNAR